MILPNKGAALLALTVLFAARTVWAQAGGATDTPPPQGPAGGPGEETGPPPGGAAGAAMTPAEALAALAQLQGQQQQQQFQPVLVLNGYIGAGFGFKVRPKALPREKLEYGIAGGHAGIIIAGSPIEQWSYVVHFILDGAAFSALTGVDVVDIDGNGSIDSISPNVQSFPGSLLEEVSITYQPSSSFALKGGQIRLPFTVEQQSANFALMFPTRAAPNEVFLSGSDRGIMAIVGPEDGKWRVQGGAFNGISLGLVPDPREQNGVRGLVYALRADIHPFGNFPFGEGDLKKGPFRMGFGAGAIYRPVTLFDRSGYEANNVHDVRVSASFRMAYQGLYLQTEVLRRQQNDDLSNRPKTATGAYAQANYVVTLSPSVAVAPQGRLGFASEDQSFAPRTTLFAEAGFSLYPRIDAREPDIFKVILTYNGERRITEGESAHGVDLTFQLRW